MKWAIFLALALAVSGCQTQSDTGGEVTASQAGQKSGTIRYRGGVYTGQLKDGKPHGQGTEKWPDGYRYTGQWRNGYENGQGTMIASDGIRITGQWKDGKPHGQVTQTQANGIRITGQWRNGELQGTATCTWSGYNKGKPYACRCTREQQCYPISS